MQVLLSFEEVLQEVAHKIVLGGVFSAVVLQSGSGLLVELNEGVLQMTQSSGIEVSVERLLVVLELPVLFKGY